MSPMRGRFAPSPTGTLHLGNLRTAMLAWLFARSARSTFSLRFEDLDQATVRPAHYDSQRRDLERLGLDWDDELRQSDHLDRYQAALAHLTEVGATYPCYCSRREIRQAASAPHNDLGARLYPGTCRDLTTKERCDRERGGRTPAIRLRSEGAEIGFPDRVCGLTTGPVDDAVLARRDGVPAYNLVVVVDDAYQQIEEVVRGDDLLASTPCHLLIARLLGAPPPTYAHVPLVLGAGGSRLAKRDGAVTLDDRLHRGDSIADLVTLLAASAGISTVREAGAVPTMAELATRFEPAALRRIPWQLSDADLGAT